MPGIDHAPPPFFKRGPAPLALLSFYVAASVALFVVDLKYHSVDFLRQGVASVVDPLQRLAQTPGAAIEQFGDYFQGTYRLQQENARLKRSQLDTAPNLGRLAHLEAENARLRRLLDMKTREKANGKVAQILYTTRDPFSRRIVIDKGLQASVEAGQPVIDEAGVVGQVTRTSLLHSEVTLITDKNQVVPVQVVRTGMRSVVYGLGDGRLELRYLPANADIKEGDVLVTSGLDAIFLPGFPVARVGKVERDSAYSFARIFCDPVSGVENFGEVFVLNVPTRPAPLPAELTKSTQPAEAKGNEAEKTETRPKKKNKPARKP
ncbi:MAG: mreC [Proteobacteria bacterium]|nr:mreC [Pseudomonadota bacterium]